MKYWWLSLGILAGVSACVFRSEPKPEFDLSLAGLELPVVQAPNLQAIDESQVEVDLRVAPPGVVPADFERIQAALERAAALARQGKSTRIRVAPGTYRETLDVVGKGGDPLLILEAEPGGEVVVSGSDRLDQWTPDPERSGQWRCAMSAFETESNPWPGLMPCDYPHFRHELLFWDGQPLFQAMTEAELRPGSYFMDDQSGQVRLLPPAGKNPARAEILASVRPAKATGAHSKLLRVYTRDNFVLRGFRFQHAMTRAFMGAVQILGSSHVRVENCSFEWNSGGGLLVNPTSQRPARDVVLRRIAANHNGFIGINGGFHDGVIEDCQTNDNNWRGFRFGTTGWAPCGFKLSRLNRVIVRRHQAMRNQAAGGWFDDQLEHVLVEDFTAIGNLRSGINFEAATGPILVRRATLVGNNVGWNVFDSSNVTMAASILLDNRRAQVNIAGSTPMPQAELDRLPRERRERLSKRHAPQHIAMLRCLVANSPEGPSDSRLITFNMRGGIFTIADGSHPLTATIKTLRFDGNFYETPGGVQALAFPNLLGQNIAWPDWKTLVSPADANSSWADPATVRRVAQEISRKHSAPPPIEPEAQEQRSTADALEL